jgi:hypothetical protein
MPAGIPFPTSRDELRRLTLNNGWARASAVLLSPKGGKNNQRMLLLAGSVLHASSVVSSCPRLRCIREQQEQLLANGSARQSGKQLRLVVDHWCNSVSQAAQLSLGASKNGWDFWRIDGKTLNDAYNDPALLFYDPESKLLPYHAVTDEVFPVTQLIDEKASDCIADAKPFQVFYHVLPSNKEWPVPPECDAVVLECRQGRLRLNWRPGPDVTTGNAVVIRGGRFVKAIENSVFTTVRISGNHEKHDG